MANKKQLIKGTIIYAIGNFGTKILSFLIVPLYTYYISTSEMGNYDLLNSTVNLLIPIVTLQIFDAAFRWMIRDEDLNGDYERSTLQIVLLNSIFAGLIIYLYNYFFPFPYPLEFIGLVISTTVLTAIQKLLRGLKNQKLYVYSSIIYTIVFLALNILFVVVLKLGVQSLFISSIIANIIAILFCFALEKKLRVNIFTKLNNKVVNQMIKFSAPLIPNQLNWWAMNSANRYIIRFFLGASANGIFAIAFKFPSILQMLLGFFNTSWQDVSVAEKGEQQSKYYSDVFKQLYRLSFSILWPLIPLTKIVVNIVMAEQYKIAANFISFLYLGTVFQSFSSFYGVGYLRDMDTKQASLTSIYGAVISILANILLVKFIGLQASGIAMFLGFFTMWIIRERQNRKSLGIHIEKKDFIIYFLLTVFIVILGCFSSKFIDFILLILGTLLFIALNWSLMISIIKAIHKAGKNKLVH